jgi:hypothetical protein
MIAISDESTVENKLSKDVDKKTKGENPYSYFAPPVVPRTYFSHRWSASALVSGVYG